MLCQRPVRKARGLLWEFVGGKVEPGETKEQALICECKEELKVLLSVCDVFMDVVHEYPDITVHLTLFNATIAEDKLRKLEHNDIKWIMPSEIQQYEFCPADEEIVFKVDRIARREMMSQRKHPKYEYLTSRWGGMKLREEFEERIDNWLKAFDESEHEMLLSLLSQFYYYSEEKVKENSKELYQKFLANNQEDKETTVFTKIIKEFGTSYSDVLFNTFWLSNDLYDYCEPNILGLLENLEESEIPKVIAIIDDYSGSGKTFVKTIDKMVNKNACVGQAHFFFLTLHITNTALELIQNYAKITGIKIDVISMDISDKTFKDDYLYNRIEARKQRKQYETLCAKNKINSDFVFGFDEIESLVAFHYNTPNNTLGLFWQDFADFMALFPRHKKQRNNLREIQNNVQKRKKAKDARSIFGFDDAKFALFMAYCVAFDKQFSFEQTKSDFGLNQEQLLDMIDRMIKEGYVITQDGKFVATPKLKSNMFTTRLKNLKKSYTVDMLVEDVAAKFDAVSYVPKKF